MQLCDDFRVETPTLKEPWIKKIKELGINHHRSEPPFN